MKNIFTILLVILGSILSLFTQWICCGEYYIDPKAVMIGRNMDWPEQMQQQIRVYPRGGNVPVYLRRFINEWISKYGSMVVTAYEI